MTLLPLLPLTEQYRNLDAPENGETTHSAHMVGASAGDRIPEVLAVVPHVMMMIITQQIELPIDCQTTVCCWMQ